MMTETIIDLAILTTVVVFIVDLSGVVDDFKRRLSRWIAAPVDRVKPFDCSLCVTWWSGLAYLLIAGAFNLRGLLAVTLCALLARPLGSALRMGVYLLEAVVAAINILIDKIYLKQNENGKTNSN